MFHLRYIAAELRRRKGRTMDLTSLGLAVGVGMVATVVALSRGLDDAQSEVLEPLTGVGTNMSVDRPIVISGSGPKESFRPGATRRGQRSRAIVEAIKVDPRLTPRARQSMLETYEALTREERRFTSEKS